MAKKKSESDVLNISFNLWFNMFVSESFFMLTNLLSGLHFEIYHYHFYYHFFPSFSLAKSPACDMQITAYK